MQLAMAFHKNFAAYSEGVSDAILDAAPLAGRG